MMVTPIFLIDGLIEAPKGGFLYSILIRYGADKKCTYSDPFANEPQNETREKKSF